MVLASSEGHQNHWKIQGSGLIKGLQSHVEIHGFGLIKGPRNVGKYMVLSIIKSLQSHSKMHRFWHYHEG